MTATPAHLVKKLRRLRTIDVREKKKKKDRAITLIQCIWNSCFFNSPLSGEVETPAGTFTRGYIENVVVFQLENRLRQLPFEGDRGTPLKKTLSIGCQNT